MNKKIKIPRWWWRWWVMKWVEEKRLWKYFPPNRLRTCAGRWESASAWVGPETEYVMGSLDGTCHRFLRLLNALWIRYKQMILWFDVALSWCNLVQHWQREGIWWEFWDWMLMTAQNLSPWICLCALHVMKKKRNIKQYTLKHEKHTRDIWKAISKMEPSLAPPNSRLGYRIGSPSGKAFSTLIWDILFSAQCFRKQEPSEESRFN